MNAVLDTSIMCTVDGPTWKPTTDKDASFLNAAAASEQHPGSRSQNLPPSPFQLRSTVPPMWLWLHVANVSIRDSRHFPFFLLTKITKCVKLASLSLFFPHIWKPGKCSNVHGFHMHCWFDATDFHGVGDMYLHIGNNFPNRIWCLPITFQRQGMTEASVSGLHPCLTDL